MATIYPTVAITRNLRVYVEKDGDAVVLELAEGDTDESPLKVYFPADRADEDLENIMRKVDEYLVVERGRKNHAG